MRGRVRYVVEIATRRDGGSWHPLVTRSGLFSRGPKATARSIVERWIFEQQGQLRGGRVVIRGRRAGVRRAFEATVRVRILAGDESGRQLAVAYIGIDHARRFVVPPSDHGRDHYLPPRSLELAGGVRG